MIACTSPAEALTATVPMTVVPATGAEIAGTGCQSGKPLRPPATTWVGSPPSALIVARSKLLLPNLVVT